MRTRFTPCAGLALISLMLLLAGGSSPADAKEFGADALMVSPDGSRLYVNNSALGAVQVIDTGTNQLLAAIPLGSNDDNLPYLAMSPDGTRLYVPTEFTSLFSDLRSDQLLVIDTAAEKVIATVGVGSWPAGAAVSPDGKRVYVANERGNSVSVVDTATLQVIASIPVGHGPSGVAASHDGRWVYVSNEALDDHLAAPGDIWTDTVSVIDTASNQVVATIPVGPSPANVVVGPDDKSVYVIDSAADMRNRRVEVIDTASNQAAATLTGQPGGESLLFALALSRDGKRLYVTGQDAGTLKYRILAIDTAPKQTAASVTVSYSPDYLTVSPDGKRIYVSDTYDQTVSVIDATTLQPLAAVKVGDVAVGG